MQTDFRQPLIMFLLKGIIPGATLPDCSKTLTRDLHGTASTGEFTRAILNALETVKVEETE